jgi:hypothetical protein
MWRVCKGGDRVIEIQLPGQLLLLTGAEILRLLSSEPEIWKTAIRRGKAAIRRRQALARVPKEVVEAEQQLLEEVLDRCSRD